MLHCLDKFRKQLDDVMLKAFGRRIILYGYGRTGRFLEWYADYYHSLKPDFIITSDWSDAMPYSLPYFRDSLFEFNYRDVKNSIVWLALPGNEEAKKICERQGFEYYDFGNMIYGDRLIEEEDQTKNIFTKKKTGVHDVQFMEYMECFYDCNFVTSVNKDYLQEGSFSYCITTQAEIFPILDKCHTNITADDAIFDFGCGKGGAILTFLDYGFMNAGGVEYSVQLYHEAVSNFQKNPLETDRGKGKVELIHNDAAKVTKELDKYNWFYFFDPFDKSIFEPVISNICDSYRRKPRKINLISINPRFYDVIESCGIFVLVNQFCASTRQKVVNIYTT